METGSLLAVLLARTDVYRLPIRDGNASTPTEPKAPEIVYRLPIRDGNPHFCVRNIKLKIVYRLPIRDGN